MSDRLAVTPQYLLPQRLLTQFAGLSPMLGGALTHRHHPHFAQYRVDMSERLTLASKLRQLHDFSPVHCAMVRSAGRFAPVCPVMRDQPYGPIEPDQLRQATVFHPALVAATSTAHQFNNALRPLYLHPRTTPHHIPC